MVRPLVPFALLLAVACQRPADPDPPAEPAASAEAANEPEPVVPAAASQPPPAPPPAACPEEMALIDDRFCIDRWEAITLELDGGAHSPYHFLRAKQVVAASRPGVVPQAYISADQADAACKRAGKRLCQTQQWLDACMGMKRPKREFPYGHKEIKEACNTHRRIHPSSRVHPERRHDSVSLNDPRLNQISDTVATTGSFEQCVTPEGVHDLHGNLLEWTRGSQPLLMGGHYIDGKKHGPGCTYVTDGHGADYHDFTTGFRCCKKPDPAGLQARIEEKREENPSAPPPAPTSSEQSRDPEGMRGFFSATGKLPAPKPPPYDPPDAACPVDMALVEGLRCSEPKQQCKEWLPRRSVGQKIACKEFAEPTTCESSRRKMRYCIDRYEYQPEGYAYPLTHVAWGEAQNLCRAMGKRLCFEDEWEFACEGPDALPYPYGYVRDGKLCNHDFPEEQLVTSPDNFIDRRVARDALPGCKSPFGVYNLVGNVDEWTTRYNAKPPYRSILRGGWWLIGRNRCRAATANHSELYASMQTGFRCCKESR
jgi:formylglycine-generating enzyme